MRVVATKFYQPEDISYLQKELPNFDFWFPQQAEDLDNLMDVVEGVNVFLGPPPPSYVIEAVSNTLKLVQIPWSGVDGIDFSACHKYAIPCANTHTNAVSVAELAVSLCLDVLKATPFHDAEFRKGHWHRPGSPEGFFPPRLLSGQSVGILGFGSIGREIHRILKGFNLDVAALSYSGRKHTDIRMFDRQTQLSEFLARSDVLFLAAPLTSETHNILNDTSLSHMRETSVLVNVSRAELIDLKALHRSLTEKKISGAALDVHWRNLSTVEQKLAKDIHNMQNVVMSPHRGGFTAGDLPHLKGAVENIRKLAEGRLDEIIGRIDFDKGY
ncbi:NAD(P)-dependent oxidoreductase [Thalassospira alkalitolerans]|uniref:NAD(P)-dependent oxidoreductase n=1 Tax=Thalassospira alkalitolerans TaxID=1293890 RepID=UPI003AA8253B